MTHSSTPVPVQVIARISVKTGASSPNVKLVSEFSVDANARVEPSLDVFPEWFEQYRNDATAIVCFYDYTAVWVMESLQSAGITVPSEMSVVGSEDVRWGSKDTTYSYTTPNGAKAPLRSVSDLLFPSD